ncbi:MAG: magnesium and cobalt transport protein CorA [Ignavibacteria bacterium]|nr:MAG: magnesium and cobalt transport protein CorA [Ignavibacteria bacterium]
MQRGGYEMLSACFLSKTIYVIMQESEIRFNEAKLCATASTQHEESSMIRLPQRRAKRKFKDAGLPPGTVIYTGEAEAQTAQLRELQYTRDDVTDEEVAIEDLQRPPEDSGVWWLSVQGVSDVTSVQHIGELFGLHILTQEDIVNAAHRPKLERFDNYLVVILRAVRPDDSGLLHEENMTLVLTDHSVLSFSETMQDIFYPNRERIKATNGRFRARGADYLLYTLIDSVVDHYVNTLEQIDDQIALLEEEVVQQADGETVGKLHDQRRNLMQLRKAVLPLREILLRLQRDETDMIGEDISMFLHDVEDHLLHVLDSIESGRENISGLLDLYMSFESNRMNEVMKVLTIIATVFIPLTFIAGVYGMNFDVMPELRIPWAYPAVLSLMAAVGVVMFLFFRRKHWL